MAEDAKQVLLDDTNQLFEQAKKDGKIDQEAIFALIPEAPENTEVLDSLYTELADANIPVDGGEAATPAVEFSDEWVAEDEEEIVLDDKVYLDDIADDSVRLYLREIGKIPLLKADEELALAKRVVAGDKDAKDQSAHGRAV